MAEQSPAVNWRRWPMLPVAVACIGGILGGDQWTVSLEMIFPTALLVLASAVLWPKARMLFLWLAVFGAAWTNIAVHQAIVSPCDLRRLAGEAPELVTLKGEVRLPPSTRVAEREGEMLWRTLVVVRAHALKRQGEWQPVHGDVAVVTQGDLSEELATGQRVEITGVLQRPPRAVAEGLFDYRAHLARQGVYFQFIAEGRQDWQIQPHAPAGLFPRLGAGFQRWARITLARGLPQEDEMLRLNWAMVLGWRAALTNEVSEPFMRSGTMHIFAISGLHVALIAAMLVHVLRLARMPRGWCGVVAIPLLWFYAGATGWQPSAVRSTIMATVVIAGWSLKRPGDLLNSLAAAAVLILFWEPQQLFQASFQLSFAVVLSIALLLPHFERVRARLFQPDPLLPPELRPRWQRWLDAPVRFLTMSFATSLAAWLGSLPLCAHYFHLFTPVGLLANLIVVPLSGLALMSACGSLFFGAWLPALSELLNHSAWFWMLCMVRVSEWCAALPGAWFPAPSFTPAAFALYYVTLLVVVTGAAFQRAQWKWVLPSVLVPALVLVAQWFNDRHATRLHVLGLRGGEAIVLDAPGRNRDWLVDCATEADVNFALAAFLQSRGVKTISHLLLTHGDHRHVSGFPLIEQRFRPRAVFTSGLPFRSPAYRAAVASLDETPGRHRLIHRSEEALPWKILHPMLGDRFSQADDGAMVLRGEFHGLRVLLLSDLGREGQRLLLERESDLRADVVIAGVPAQGEPVRDDLLAAIQPHLVILSAGEFPAGERPGEALRQRLARRRIPVVYTLDSGSVTVSFRPDDCEVRAMDGRTFHLRPRSQGGD
jgi:competence protein ComEC